MCLGEPRGAEEEGDGGYGPNQVMRGEARARPDLPALCGMLNMRQETRRTSICPQKGGTVRLEAGMRDSTEDGESARAVQCVCVCVG